MSHHTRSILFVPCAAHIYYVNKDKHATSIVSLPEVLERALPPLRHLKGRLTNQYLGSPFATTWIVYSRHCMESTISDSWHTAKSPLLHDVSLWVLRVIYHTSRLWCINGDEPSIRCPKICQSSKEIAAPILSYYSRRPLDQYLRSSPIAGCLV
jgi:hypothetical protein